MEFLLGRSETQIIIIFISSQNTHRLKGLIVVHVLVWGGEASFGVVGYVCFTNYMGIKFIDVLSTICRCNVQHYSCYLFLAIIFIYK